jgi:hypothetical protein
MKQVFTLAVFFLASLTVKAQLWSENFSDEANGAQSGTAGGTVGGTWAVNVDPSGTFSIQGNTFQLNNTGTEGTWSTNVIDISSVGYAIIDVDVFSFGIGFSASDYLAFYYKLDDGPETQFSFVDANFISATPSVEISAIVAGTSLQIIIKGVDNSWFGYLSFDNVTVTAAPIIYSRKSGTWTDVTGGVGGSGTWSLTSHTGSACGCYPLNTQVAIIGSGHTVTLPSSQINVGTPPTANLAPGAVDVYGTLQYNTNNVTIGIQQGLFRVRNGGTVNSSGGGILGEQISFNADVGGATMQVDAGGNVIIEDFVIGTEAPNFHYLTGEGALSITDDIIINAVGATLTNNRSASFTVGDDLNFNASNNTFINNGIVIITGDILPTNNGDDDNVITNANGASLSFANVDANNADLDIYNSGTIYQSGNFIDINNSDTNFDNLATGTWNWNLTPNTGYDTDVNTVMNLTAIGNTFNYGAAGNQRIIPITHHHILLSNSGAKDANNASFAVRGNWTVSGTATFTEGTGTISLNGTGTQSITNPSGETFYRLTINNSFGASPQIALNGNVIVTNTLTMQDGNVNLNGNTFTVGTSVASTGILSHAGVSTNGWMYGGNLVRYMANAATTIGGGDQHEGFFPLGSASDFRPFYIGKTNTTNSGGAVTVSHTNSTTTSTVSFTDTNPVAIITRRHDSYWTVVTSGISAGTWSLRAGGTNFGTIEEAADLRMSTSTGVVGTNSTGTGGPTDYRVNRTGLTYIQLSNNFHVASTDAANSPLPIELISFTAELKNSVVELKWSTASETDNDFFTIERATDIEHFEGIIDEDGMGTTKELHKYMVIDASPLYGRSYYRLKQTDFDGKFSYSPLQVINYEGPKYATLSAFPNPLSKSDLTIRIEGLKEATVVPVQILNMQGQTVYEKIIEVKTPGIVTEEIPANYFLNSGLYIIKAGETLYMTQKIVVE